jgi:hypothetical protein
MGVFCFGTRVVCNISIAQITGMVPKTRSFNNLRRVVMKAFIALAFILSVACSASFGQTATPKATKRQIHQQQRIKEGVKSGELTKKEAARLEVREHKIAKDKREAKADGVVTPQERAKIQREQNKASRRIYLQKHDAQKRK